MKLSTNNFFTAIKSLVMGGGRNSAGEAFNDAGFLVDRDVMNTPVSAAASDNSITVLNVLVPRDYDEATDEFTVEVVAKMAGATDTPTLTLAPTVAGVALAASDGSLTTAALSTTATKYTFSLSGNELERDDVVTLTITSGAHTTDALELQVVRVSYRSTLVSYDETDGSSNSTGNPLR